MMGGPSHRTLSAKPAAVRLVEVWKTLGSTQALAGVSLDIEAGEFVTLLGPSGSGKTSCLMAVAGFIVPERGRIIVGGRDLTHVPPGRQRDMGIVFQNYALFPHMTVAKNVAYPLQVRGVPRREIRERVDKALALVHLDGLEERKPAMLSGGQQQRVALARALVFEPAVLLMDEPMGALDVRLKQELQWEIRRLQRAIGATVIYVTHDQVEAMLLSDRVALLQDGRVAQYGRPQELYRKPRSLFAARFLGESNLIMGRYESGPPAGLRNSATGFLLPVDGAARAGSVAGQPYAALLRPEALSLRPAGDDDVAPQPDSTSIPGVVEEAVFVGQTMRYVVRADRVDAPLIVQQPGRTSVPELSPGSNATVSWHDADVHLIATSQGRDGEVD